ncbi:hypothetical protein [Nonlabens tegetincola]|uniref:hypothetical protein n=1 Tax=Nonlabens tegetincola TaxID=323273 RepID=UPI0030C81A67
MKLISVIFLFSFATSLAQVGINTTSPADGTALDISSSDKGILIPKVSLNSTNSLSGINLVGSTLEEGVLVYNTATTTGINAVSPGFYYWNGSNSWILLTNLKDWSVEGNNAISTDRFGTNNNIPVIIKTNNNDRFQITTSGRLLSYSNGTESLPSYSFANKTNSGMYLNGSDEGLMFTSDGYDFLKLQNFGTSRQITLNPDGDGDMSLQIRGDSNVILSANSSRHNLDVGSNANPEYASLALSQSNRGLLLNRVSLTAANSFSPLPSNPASGTMVYNRSENLTPSGYLNDVRQGVYVWNGSRWIPQFAETRSARFGNAANRTQNLNDFTSNELELFSFAEWNDDYSLFNVSYGSGTTRLTIGEDGRFEIKVNMSIIVDSGSTNVDIQLDAELRVDRGGTTIYPGTTTSNNYMRNRNGVTTSSININELVELEAGDQVYIHVEQTGNTGTVTMRPEAGSNFFTIKKIK